MLPLDDSRWGTYVGGYRMAYDASSALTELFKLGSDRNQVLEELENELYHQGDLGSASSAAVPWLVEYLRRCPEFEVRVAALILAIEFGRPHNQEPVPEEIRASYGEAIRQLPDIILSKRDHPWNDSQVALGAAILAMGQSNRWFARTYFELDRSMLDHMLKQEFGSADWDGP